MNNGDRVLIVGQHPWSDEVGTLIVFEEYGPGNGLRWKGWRVALDIGTECYVNPANLLLVRAQRATKKRARS